MNLNTDNLTVAAADKAAFASDEIHTDQKALSSIFNSVPILSGSEEQREMAALRDSFFVRIPPQSKTEAVRTIWQELWAKAMAALAPDQMHKFGEAFVFAAEAHADQKRSTGDPYIIHTLSAALILAELKLDLDSLTAALLHDVLEDTSVTPDEMREAFGPEVLTLVDGVTKLGKVPFMSFEGYQSKNLRKMFIVMARDIRVVLIKLADRLHNMRTLGALRREKQERIARETLDIFAPLAHRLGIYKMKRELEDLSFRYIEPDLYQEIRSKVKRRLPEMEEVIKKGIQTLEERLAKEGIPCKIKGRAKHYYSIYEKMQRKKLSVDELYDILAVRITVDDLPTCYAVLGIVHAIWVPIPGQFDDYIATPKSNMYQSLHTTVMAFGVPLEVQIRTYEMNYLAEYGIAAHWLYKSKGTAADSLDSKLMWIRQALEAEQEGGSDSEEFLDLLKSDILTTDIYVFTPQGKPMIMPSGATVIDFAYAIHTEVGNHCVGATVNNRIVTLNSQLRSGDIIKIITSPQGSPSRDWLKIAHSSKTRSKIRNYFRQAEKVDRDEKIARGWEALERELHKRGVKIENTPESHDEFVPSLNKVARDSGLAGHTDLLIAVGSGTISLSSTAQQTAMAYMQQHHTPEDITAFVKKHSPSRRHDSDIVVEGEGGVSVVFANCCTPIHGDDIVGYSTKTRGITIHRADCPNIAHSRSAADDNSEPHGNTRSGAPGKPLRGAAGRVIEVSWSDQPSGKMYTARLKAEAVDRDNLIRDTAQAIGLAGGSISGIKASVIGNSLMRMKIDLKVRDVEHLYTMIARINEIKGVMEVTRA